MCYASASSREEEEVEEEEVEEEEGCMVREAGRMVYHGMAWLPPYPTRTAI